MLIRIINASIHLIDLKTRLPFKYGIATMTSAPHAFVRLHIEVDGQQSFGIAADSLPPKWFTKNPDMIRLPSNRLLLIYSDTDAHWSLVNQIMMLLASDDGGSLEDRRRVVVLVHVPGVGELKEDDPDMPREVVRRIGLDGVENEPHECDQDDGAQKRDDERDEQSTTAAGKESVDAVAPSLSKRRLIRRDGHSGRGWPSLGTGTV